MSVAALVLAAGASRRLGRAKQTVVLGGEMLVDRAIRVATEAGLAPVIVVVRGGSEIAQMVYGKACEVVLNEQANEGLASSIRNGLVRAIELQVDGAVLMACDQVGLTAEHLRELSADVNAVRGSGYGGRTGVPAYFPASSFGRLLELRGDVGARELLRGAETVIDEGLELDIDTEADIERARKLFAQHV